MRGLFLRPPAAGSHTPHHRRPSMAPQDRVVPGAGRGGSNRLPEHGRASSRGTDDIALAPVPHRPLRPPSPPVLISTSQAQSLAAKASMR